MRTAAMAIACAGALLAASAWGQQDPNYARNLAAACFTCHGTDGRSVGGVPPSLAGQDRNILLQALKEFKSGKRPATIMHQQAKGYTDEELEALAGYFSRAKPGQTAPAPSPSSRY